ncbi:MAG: adenosylcobinamide-GDP ribazoletransferase [Spirochaetia bacterium]|nr:adenosylcobinamide-GDP ribazoletransferase [Spirochaetia bacterium]
MLKSIAIAFQMYSHIPIPSFEWDEKSRKYALCFFPLVGAVIGSLEYLWFFLAALLETPVLIGTAVATAIPFLITGGIHMDGFCDTVDALSSQASMERKLEILKDPHAGAFAIIFAALYILLYFAGWSAVSSMKALEAVCIGFVLSRALSGLAAVKFKGARKEGMLQNLADATAKRTTIILMLLYIALCAAVLVILCGWLGLLILCVNELVFLYYRLTAYKKFGGITGDLAGWFLQLAELATILCIGLCG